MILEQKQSLRSEARRVLTTLDSVRRLEESRKIVAHLVQWDSWINAQTVCAFVALDSEPDVLTPWPAGKRIILPRVAGSLLELRFVEAACDLIQGSFGILEPSLEAPPAPAEADLILVPGLAFDPCGVRLGRGRGFYDRLLSSFSGTRVGVCFEESVLSQLPAEPHDERMDYLLTPAGIISCGFQNRHPNSDA
ncbi:MAG: 5-formyltetrahydrofolate cyclo-ligase [bacterium]